ncbi:hypothetical protein GE061_001455 [Apolygus lucorum]|uniref:PiggyBac transposable element-derived protein domain-containing protein n=1 Tax=Apolygus lucorum TaxID=248454 RepID=A0A8S9Y747_APOLU|nr:hypothetical protein GE061_001455 [Apolygus lucorum]
MRRFVHFVDNSESETTTDRYYKIRPLMEKIRERCLELDGDEEKYSIDETMVPYKGKKAGGLRQFMKDKPSRWGFKMFVRSGTSGMIYDFMPCSGDSTFDRVQFSTKEENFLFSEKCIVALAKTIPNPPLHALYFDNFYSSIRLMLHLRNHYGLLSLGTFRPNRTEGANTKFVTDRELVKRGRGSYDELVHESRKDSATGIYVCGLKTSRIYKEMGERRKSEERRSMSQSNLRVQLLHGWCRSWRYAVCTISYTLAVSSVLHADLRVFDGCCPRELLVVI